MLFRRIGTELIYNVTNPDLIPLYEGNEAYEVIVKNESVKDEKAEKKPAKK